MNEAPHGTLIDARELALRAASLLAGGRADDPDWVRAAAAPIIAWAEEADGEPAGMDARCRALSIHLDNLHNMWHALGDLAGYTPEGFALAADGYYLSLMGEPAPPLPEDLPDAYRPPAWPGLADAGGRMMSAVRALLLAAGGGDLPGWRKLLAGTVRYAGQADPPLTDADYASAWLVLFGGDALTAAAGQGAEPASDRPGTPGYAAAPAVAAEPGGRHTGADGAREGAGG
jgi:hypothetical protein